SAGNKYKKDDKVDAVVIKYNKHGALASIEEGVAGLVHISEYASEEELRGKLELGKVYPFTITLFEPKERRMTLKPVH
ncbi:MAG TPA: S1 RNA-binding domain-containing protein, partial [Candidatus Paceibacterota bacterium]